MVKSIEEFLTKNKNTLFRYWIRKTIWTPYDIDKKDKDVSPYINEEAYYGYIIEAIDLHNGDYLIGIELDNNSGDYIEYYRLSEIELAIAQIDQE